MPTLIVKVVPNASRTKIVGMLGDALKIQVAAPPEKGKANQAVIELLAEFFGVKMGEIELLSGHTQARKTFLLKGVKDAAFQSKLRDFQ
jgi:uncharacterized protein (TIGR00251 family)